MVKLYINDFYYNRIDNIGLHHKVDTTDYQVFIWVSLSDNGGLNRLEYAFINHPMLCLRKSVKEWLKW